MTYITSESGPNIEASIFIMLQYFFRDTLVIDVTKSFICTTLFTRQSVDQMERTTTLLPNGTYRVFFLINKYRIYTIIIWKFDI